jgi:flagellum-specific ATP synthase
MFNPLLSVIDAVNEEVISGKVSALKGLVIECLGLSEFVSLGSRCLIINRSNHSIEAEVVGFRKKTVLLMPYAETQGIGVGCKVQFLYHNRVIFPDESWLGRVINALGIPLDQKGLLISGKEAYQLKAPPPPAHQRTRIVEKIDLGIKAINTFISCCYGQRMGIFAGSGVGKSVLISMLAKFAQSDIKIIGLIGERGREVQEFLHDFLGQEGLKNTIIIVSTSDEAALMRKQAAYLSITLAEYFRDKKKNVILIMDNITRFAMAQREIGLASGEPPSSKGYTPTVFSELPKLLERAGPGVVDSGNITAFFTVLVEGDDHNEPISDAVRGIIDGHIVLDREIAQRGRFPAINILKSISRVMPKCNSAQENALVSKARKILAVYEDMAEMIRLGAYKVGSDAEVDLAIKYYPLLNDFLSQKPDEFMNMQEAYQQLAAILDHNFIS